MALDIEDPRTYANSEPHSVSREPWPSESFDFLDDDSLERLCIDAGEELLRRYGVRLEKLAQAIGGFCDENTGNAHEESGLEG